MKHNEEYITKSLQTGLLSARLVYDHIIFIEITAPEYEKHLEEEKLECEKLLNLALNLADGKVSQFFLESEVLVTNTTSELEKRTSKIFRIKIDEKITNKSLNLKSGKFQVNDYLFTLVSNLNSSLINFFYRHIDTLKELNKKVLEKKYELYCSINFIDHYITETEIFIYNLETLEIFKKGTPTYAYNNEYYFNYTMKEHCEFFCDNYELFNLYYLNLSMKFLEEFSEMLKEFTNEIAPQFIDIMNLKTTIIVERFKLFTENFVLDLVDKNFYEIIIPLYYDHLLRECNIILFSLKSLKD